MATINTVDKYIDLYAVHKKSREETKHLEYCLTQLEYNLQKEDLKKLDSVLTKYEFDRLSKRVDSRNIPELPWNCK